MSNPNNDKPALTPITQNGTYRLSLSKPKFEKVKQWDDGTVSARLFFKTNDGKFLTHRYGTKYGKSLAMLVGKLSGKFTEEIRSGATVAEFIDYVSAACGIYADIAVEVSQAKDRDGNPKFYNGEPEYAYRLSFSKGSQKPVAKPESNEAIDF
jgi:hypothetical protein